MNFAQWLLKVLTHRITDALAPSIWNLVFIHICTIQEEAMITSIIQYYRNPNRFNHWQCKAKQGILPFFSWLNRRKIRVFCTQWKKYNRKISETYPKLSLITRWVCKFDVRYKFSIILDNVLLFTKTSTVSSNKVRIFRISRILCDDNWKKSWILLQSIAEIGRILQNVSQILVSRVKGRKRDPIVHCSQ